MGFDLIFRLGPETLVVVKGCFVQAVFGMVCVCVCVWTAVGTVTLVWVIFIHSCVDPQA